MSEVNRSNLWISHSSLTIATLVLCSLYLFFFDGLREIGNLWKSPTVPILIASELLKWLVNVKCFKLVGRPKHIPSTYQRRELQAIDRIKYFCGIIVTLAAFFGLYAFVCIIFGAAIIEDSLGTMCLSTVLVTLTVLPLVLYLGGRATWELMFCDQFELTSSTQSAYLEYVRNNAMACMFGAWISSIVAPLDWDRDWQHYPIPNVCGAIMGTAVSNLYWLTVGIAQRFARHDEGRKQRKSN